MRERYYLHLQFDITSIRRRSGQAHIPPCCHDRLSRPYVPQTRPSPVAHRCMLAPPEHRLTGLQLRQLRPHSSMLAAPFARHQTPSRLLAPLAPALGRTARHLSQQTRASIEAAVKSAPVVLFMKGTPEMPQCGFSRGSVQILGLQGLDPQKFAAYNVLESDDLRAGTLGRWGKRSIQELAANERLSRDQRVLGVAHHPPALCE